MEEKIKIVLTKRLTSKFPVVCFQLSQLLSLIDIQTSSLQQLKLYLLVQLLQSYILPITVNGGIKLEMGALATYYYSLHRINHTVKGRYYLH